MISAIRDTWRYFEDVKDPRTTGWFLVMGFFPGLAILLTYVYLSIKGPKLMENFKPLSLKYVLVAYNLVLVCLSAYMFLEILTVSLKSNYNYACQPCDYSNGELPLRMANVIWLHYISKFIELADTGFAILRKKNEQLSGLHIYHHCSVVGVWWSLVTYSPGGHIFFPAMLNSLVHTIMYLYYLLAALGDWVKPYLFWKRYLTQLQVVQLMSMSIHYMIGIYNSCFGSNAYLYVGIVYIFSLCVLFAKYYTRTYKESKGKLEAKKRT